MVDCYKFEHVPCSVCILYVLCIKNGKYTLVYPVFILKLCLLIVTSMDDFSKTIPAVCSLTLQCPGARNSGVQCDNNNMVIVNMNILHYKECRKFTLLSDLLYLYV